jgi:hypothetical protein
MYKTRLRKWGLGKNKKEHEMKALLSKRMERAAVGKDTACELRGNLVNMADVERYAQRKPITPRDIIAWRAAGGKTPPGLRCFTPKPVVRSLDLPTIFDTPAKLFGDIRIYSVGSFEAGTWVSQGLEHFCSSTKTVHASSDTFEEIRGCLISACILVSQNSISEAINQLDKACSKVQEIVLAEDLQTIPRLIEMMILVKAFGRPELVGMILRQLAAMSTIILPTPQYPMCRIFAALCRLELQQFDEVVLRAWECMNDVLHEVLGPSHLSTIVSKLDRLDTATSSLDPEHSDEYLRKVLKADRAATGSDMLRSLSVLVNLGAYLSRQKRYSELLDVGAEIIDRTTSWDAADPEGRRLLRCGVEWKATAHFAQCQFEQAMPSFEMLVGLAWEELGWEDPKTLEYWSKLEECKQRRSW